MISLADILRYNLKIEIVLDNQSIPRLEHQVFILLAACIGVNGSIRSFCGKSQRKFTPSVLLGCFLKYGNGRGMLPGLSSTCILPRSRSVRHFWCDWGHHQHIPQAHRTCFLSYTPPSPSENFTSNGITLIRWDRFKVRIFWSWDKPG